MASNDTIKKTFIVAIVLCLVCSVIVSMSSVLLKPIQLANKDAFLKRNILQAASMYDQEKSIDEQFEQFTARMVDLETGKFTDAVDAEGFDQLKAAKDPALSIEIPDDQDVAKISRRAKYAKVYTLDGANGIETIIVPIKGYGLWGTLYGYLALEADANTVVGLSYYDHKETPGLGGEVDNPRWKALWEGKKIYDRNNDVAISVAKGAVDSNDPNLMYKVDGLAGATLTSRGVDLMFKYWLGKNGYEEFLSNLRQGKA
ncbi:MAG: Na(+)-translocating NADH-quinone reductase subunit C [Cellvibrionaceae bacterium]